MKGVSRVCTSELRPCGGQREEQEGEGTFSHTSVKGRSGNIKVVISFTSRFLGFFSVNACGGQREKEGRKRT